MWLIGYVDAVATILGMSVIMAGGAYVIMDHATRGNLSWQATLAALIAFFFPALYFFLWVTGGYYQ